MLTRLRRGKNSSPRSSQDSSPSINHLNKLAAPPISSLVDANDLVDNVDDLDRIDTKKSKAIVRNLLAGAGGGATPSSGRDRSDTLNRLKHSVNKVNALSHLLGADAMKSSEQRRIEASPEARAKYEKATIEKEKERFEKFLKMPQLLGRENLERLKH